MDRIETAGLSVSVQKPEFGPASIDARNVTRDASATATRVQGGSVIRVDGVDVESEDGTSKPAARRTFEPDPRG